MTLSRRGFVSGGLALMGSAALAEAPLVARRPQARPAEAVIGTGGPDRPVDRIVARPDLGQIIAGSGVGGVTAVILADAATGRVIEGQDMATAMPPASVTKAVTALYALEALGGDHRFVTRVLATGPIVNGVLEGDLILKGGGDPVMDTDDLARLEQDLTARGLTGVRGRYIVDPGPVGAFDQIDPGQLPHLGYNPGVGGLNLNFNRVHFEWQRSGEGYAVTMQARTEAYRPDVSVARMAVVERGSPVFAYEDLGDADGWTVARSALGQNGSRWLPVRRPVHYAGEVFRTLLTGAGVSMPPMEIAAVPDARLELARWGSPPLRNIIRDMLRFSTNLTAEVLGLAASVARGADTTSLAASAAAMNGWLSDRYGVQAAFVDHSGLGEASRISPQQMMRLLCEARDTELPDLLRDIRVVNDAREAIPDPGIDVKAKTGTLNFVSSLAGYVRPQDGAPPMAFAIFSADLVAREAGKLTGQEQPPGASVFNTRAKRMQQAMLRHWARRVVQ